jgi:Ca2+-binding RTX toxin-like protein
MRGRQAMTAAMTTPDAAPRPRAAGNKRHGRGPVGVGKRPLRRRAGGPYGRQVAARTRLAIVCSAAALAGALPGAAHATTLVELSGPRLRVAAEAGRVNDVTVVRLVNGMVEISDGGDRVLPGSGCSAVDADTVRCQAGVTSLGIDAGDLDDRVVVSASIADVFVSGSGGADWLQVAGDRTLISGGTGNDPLLGTGLENVLDGGPGGDVLDGVNMTCADYSARTAPVQVTLDGVINDGELGEGDDVRPDVECVIGGWAEDVLIGSGRSNRLFGGLGNDELSGDHGRRDVLIGGEGDDTLDGGNGRDDLIGGAGDDKHYGGSFSDRMIAEPGDGDDIYAGGVGDGDEVSYALRSAWVFVDIDGVQDDGGSGERDDVGTDVEKVTGGDGDDTIRGSGAANYLRGGPGRDSLNALGGDDALDGGPGGDALAGAATVTG